MRPEHCLAMRWPRLRAAAERERRAAPGKHVPASVFLTSCIHLATVLVVYTVRLTEEFVAWLDALSDKRAQVRIAARHGCVRLKPAIWAIGSRSKAMFRRCGCTTGRATGFTSYGAVGSSSSS